MNQLSLIPVNASLFAALLKRESVVINTLTQLYYELTCYLIRRQLSRMGLGAFAGATKIHFFMSVSKTASIEWIYGVPRSSKTRININ